MASRTSYSDKVVSAHAEQSFVKLDIYIAGYCDKSPSVAQALRVATVAI